MAKLMIFCRTLFIDSFSEQSTTIVPCSVVVHMHQK